MIEFKFPEDEEDFQTVVELGDLKNRLKDAAGSIKIQQSSYRLTQPKQKYIYARCAKCPARLKYRKDGQVFRLIQFSATHNHSHSTRSQNHLLRSFIQSLPLSMTTSNRKAVVQNQYHISDRKFYYLNRKSNFQRSDFADLVKKLDNQKYQSRYAPYPLQKGVIPSLFITSSPIMRESFQKYGQFTSVDVTYNLIKQKVNGRGWGVCMFLGLNSHMHIIPFALAIMNDQSEPSFSSLFLSFFQIMKGEPETILSDEQLSIKSSLIKLKENGSWAGQHLFDQFHILKNLKKRFKNERILNLLKDAIFTQAFHKYVSAIQQAKLLVENERQAKFISQFIAKSPQFAVSQCAQTFFGTAINTSYGQKANDIIKSYIEYERPAVQCLHKLLKVMAILQQKSRQYKISNISFETLFKDSQLKHLRYLYCQRIYLVILQTYISSLVQHPDQTGENSWVFRLKDNSVQAQVVKIGNVFRCSCNILPKKGIPCSHLFFCLRSFHQNYETYIHKRWLIDLGKQVEPIQCKKGRPRLSRRNMI